MQSEVGMFASNLAHEVPEAAVNDPTPRVLHVQMGRAHA
jgi:hypothetical protein